MPPKQKRAVAALIVAALVAAAALFAPGVKCEPDQSLIEDALGDESSSGAAPGPDVPGSAPDLGSSSGSSESSGSTGA